jgi:hypothetical protein
MEKYKIKQIPRKLTASCKSKIWIKVMVEETAVI